MAAVARMADSMAAVASMAVWLVCDGEISMPAVARMAA